MIFKRKKTLKTFFKPCYILFMNEINNAYTVRKMTSTEYGALADFTYQAIFIPDGVVAPPKTIVNTPELRIYHENFGQLPHDTAFSAEFKGKVVGAAWARIISDYGHVNEDTPSVAIAMLEDHRGKGVGTALLEKLLAELGHSGISAASLSVQKQNPAVHLYERFGFVTVRETDEEFVMVVRLPLQTHVR